MYVTIGSHLSTLINLVPSNLIYDSLISIFKLKQIHSYYILNKILWLVYAKLIVLFWGWGSFWTRLHARGSPSANIVLRSRAHLDISELCWEQLRHF